MKFLHLSDLHIGKVVNGFSMLTEQRHVFLQIIEYIDTLNPDAVLIAGDVYDKPIPGVDAVRLFDDFLTAIAEKNVTVIIISGNHDSSERLHYASRILEKRNLHICGIYEKTMKKVILSDAYGEVTFWQLPFIKPASIRSMFPERTVEDYGDAVNAVVESEEIDYKKRNVLLSHQFYTSKGQNPIRSESEIDPVGGLDAVDANMISQFDYVALGHLHRAQNIRDNVRYAGSPLKYSFSEWKHKKSITLVELKEKGDCNITPLPLTPIHEMREIKGPIAQLMSREVSDGGDKEDYLRVILTDEEELIDPMGKLRSVYPNVMALDFDNTKSRINKEALLFSNNQTETISPYELFCDFYMEINGSVMSEEQMEIVRSLLEEGEMKA
ncbi:exonuclease SbcCD subunit D [Lachnospiraceae bacterium OttesenSCG-928-D06]|nr:exonuclease SbcCD subunit D [Lachnospiraceae bacterium OttesenSCG-928-D06]